jgi:hypothetical protein
MKKFIKFAAISLGSLLVALLTAGVLLLLVVNYRTERRHRVLVQSVTKKVGD